MTDQEVLQLLSEIAKRYNQDEWPLYDLQNDLEELFDEMEKRCGQSSS